MPRLSLLHRRQSVAVKPVIFAAAALVFSIAGAQAPARFGDIGPLTLAPSKSGWDLLGDTMAHQRDIPCKCLVLRRDTMRLDAPLEIWSEQSADGRLKLTVLSPLSEQGVTSIDDGHDWITYRPDDNRLIVEPSPSENREQEARQRVRLAQKNYDLIVEPKEVVIAGRKTISLLALAKHRLMPSRRYCVDASKDFLLRMEILGSDPKVMLDTKTIEFPSSVPDEDFELAPREKALLGTYDPPVSLSINRRSKDLVGFTPAIPSWLPFGFVIDQSQLVHGQNGPFVAVRLTDGLVSATLYEWNAKKPQSPIGEAKFDQAAKGMKLRLVGEMPEAVVSSLIQSFVKEAMKQSPCLLLDEKETQGTGLALNTSEQTNPKDDSEATTLDDSDQVFAILIIEIAE